MKKEFCKTMSYFMTAALVLGVTLPSSLSEAKKKVPKLSSSKVSIKIGQSKVLKVKNTKKKVKWSVGSGKKNVSLTKKKKTSVTVKGKKAGKATVIAKIGAKKISCKVTVSKKNSQVKATPVATATTPSTATATATAMPTATAMATVSPTTTAEATAAATAMVKPTSTPKPTVAPQYTPSVFKYEGLDQKWIDENIDKTKPVVAMSFDDGPGTYDKFVDYGMQIQKALKEANAHATFFYIGTHIKRDEQTKNEVKEAWKAGFEVANHSYDTAGLNSATATMIKDKIDKTNKLLSDITGYSKFLFRAPNVSYSQAMYAVIDAPFIDVSIWSNDYQDKVNKDDIVKNVTTKLADGGIINMHSVLEKTAQAVPEILKYCKEHDYQVVSVSELFAIKGKELITGQKYYNAN